MSSARMVFGCVLSVVMAGGFVTGGTAAGAPGQQITVTSTLDLAAVDPLSGECRTASGVCTLRAAVQAANARPGSTIVVPEGVYRLTIAPNGWLTNGPLIDPQTGDLAITAPTTIHGAGRDKTTIAGTGLDRLILTAADAEITDLTLTGGVSAQHEIPFYSTGGGAIANNADLTLSRVRIAGNRAGYGGGVFNIPTSDMHMTDSVVEGNIAGSAGGIRCDSTCTIVDSVIRGNRAENPGEWWRPGGFAGHGGGIDVKGIGSVTVIRTVIVDNFASDNGGGLNIAAGYLDTLPDGVSDSAGISVTTVHLDGSTIARNTIGAGLNNCNAEFSAIVSDGANTSDDSSCGLTRSDDHIGPYPD
ncbi:hypothetical protein ACFVAV_17820 [Nocardia sp. NPDC057663]|uniref:hypothetical protein n=1 Tax=Nocardia sp. NPDC057663 TaxID=3346201 RepID=UPI00366AD558